MVGIGFHGDAVPHQKSSSVYIFSWNALATATSERVLFSSIQKEFLCQCGCHGRCTLDGMLDVFRWCISILVSGHQPTCRHDMTAWEKSDTARAVISGKLPFSGLLMQIRGDWAFFKETFGFPSWSGKHRICWKCRADRDNYKDFSAGALWRRQRISPEEFFAEQLSQGVSPSPIFNSPGFQLSWVCIDMLHALDLGVSQKILGNVFEEARHRICAGGNIKNKTEDLWRQMQGYHKVAKPTSQLDGLTPEMVRQNKKGPKLRSKGGECRGLIAFGFQLAVRMQEADDCEFTRTILRMMSCLLSFYQMVDLEVYPQADAARQTRKCCLFYKSLSDEAISDYGTDTKRWTLSPKFHLWVELAEYQGRELGSPRLCWAYRDECFVGWASQLATSRGGANRCASSAQSLIDKYRAWVGS